MTLDLEALEGPITRILTAPGTDLSTISAKRVRKALLEDPQYAHLRLTSEVLQIRREDVNQTIARIFELVSRAASSEGGEGEEQPPTEPSEDAGEGEGEGEGEDDDDNAATTKSSPGKKRGTKKKSVEESDAVLARKLSAEINGRSRRGAASSTAARASSSPRKAKQKPKKSAETVDSDGEDGEPKPKKRNAAKGGFAKEYTLSVPLSAVLAVEKLSRPQVVKKLWEYIRENELQNPLNRKEIVCDDALRAVFAVDKIDMFRMNKVLGQHLHEG